MPRYRLYREHKYLTFRFSEFNRLVAKTDFTSRDEVENIKANLSQLKNLLHEHAVHEDRTIHELLRQINSSLQDRVEAGHAEHDGIFQQLEQWLEKVLNSSDNIEKIEYGYLFYLDWQFFEAKNLFHQHYEESVLLPEIQKHYTDEEIFNAVDCPIYEAMSMEDLLNMCQELFPHFNSDDRAAFLKDIQAAQPILFPSLCAKMNDMVSITNGA